jgi:hypothetical protein
VAGFIYFGRTAKGVIKIGFSRDPSGRRRYLRNDVGVVGIRTPVVFVDWFVVPTVNGQSDESALHNCFSQDALGTSREWYKPRTNAAAFFDRLLTLDDVGRRGLIYMTIATCEIHKVVRIIKDSSHIMARAERLSNKVGLRIRDGAKKEKVLK